MEGFNEVTGEFVLLARELSVLSAQEWQFYS